MFNNKSLLNEIICSRREYKSSTLNHADLPNNPLTLFEEWLIQAYSQNIKDPTAMVLSTVSRISRPAQRIVLLKYFDQKELIFYTNLDSKKVREIKSNNYVALLFPWTSLERQVIFSGIASILPTYLARKYFSTRPRNFKITAWASKQSQIIESRQVLIDRVSKVSARFQDKADIPLPNFWGGIRVRVNQVEFWQGRKDRLHDRFLYKKRQKWVVVRLSP